MSDIADRLRRFGYDTVLTPPVVFEAPVQIARRRLADGTQGWVVMDGRVVVAVYAADEFDELRADWLDATIHIYAEDVEVRRGTDDEYCVLTPPGAPIGVFLHDATTDDLRRIAASFVALADVIDADSEVSSLPAGSPRPAGCFVTAADGDVGGVSVTSADVPKPAPDIYPNNDNEVTT